MIPLEVGTTMPKEDGDVLVITGIGRVYYNPVLLKVQVDIEVDTNNGPRVYSSETIGCWISAGDIVDVIASPLDSKAGLEILESDGLPKGFVIAGDEASGLRKLEVLTNAAAGKSEWGEGMQEVSVAAMVEDTQRSLACPKCGEENLESPMEGLRFLCGNCGSDYDWVTCLNCDEAYGLGFLAPGADDVCPHCQHVVGTIEVEEPLECPSCGHENSKAPGDMYECSDCKKAYRSVLCMECANDFGRLNVFDLPHNCPHCDSYCSL